MILRKEEFTCIHLQASCFNCDSLFQLKDHMALYKYIYIDLHCIIIFNSLILFLNKYDFYYINSVVDTENNYVC